MRVHGKAPLIGADPIIDIGDGLRLPRRVEVEGRDVQGYDVTMGAEFNRDSGRYECRSLTVSAQEGTEVTGEALRSVPVQTVLRLGIESAVKGSMALNMGPMPEDIAEGGPTTRALKWVAYLYRVALIFGESPVQTVALGLDLPKSTAARWVTRARDRGLLTVQDRRGRRKADD
ncbi:hypothetical protein [Nocardiopsis lucentensis]|uniref:hypothetical protein n=1 Tax=Nocardiopsis lucentensis TaxID=53441 RepID=UPI00034B1337|nr:hypothetical protein [Nocardiopsis lucentensis]